MQQAFAGNTGDNMAAAANSFAAIMYINGVPDHKVISNLLVGFVICSLERAKRAIRENDAPAIGDIGRVAFNDCNVMARIGLFDQQATIEACWTAAEDDYFHAIPPYT